MTKDSKETQHEKFQRVARELQTDESEEAFDRALKK
ncbi:MAG: DNA-binding protein, partial [Mesorhizobium sp.]